MTIVDTHGDVEGLGTTDVGTPDAIAVYHPRSTEALIAIGNVLNASPAAIERALTSTQARFICEQALAHQMTAKAAKDLAEAIDATADTAREYEPDPADLCHADL